MIATHVNIDIQLSISKSRISGNRHLITGGFLIEKKNPS